MKLDRDQVVWRYMAKGKTSHAVRIRGVVPSLRHDWVALCGFEPHRTSGWLGTDNAKQREALRSRPLCSRCLGKLAPLHTDTEDDPATDPAETIGHPGARDGLGP